MAYFFLLFPIVLFPRNPTKLAGTINVLHSRCSVLMVNSVFSQCRSLSSLSGQYEKQLMSTSAVELLHTNGCVSVAHFMEMSGM